jgi:hypothetical protein
VAGGEAETIASPVVEPRAEPAERAERQAPEQPPAQNVGGEAARQAEHHVHAPPPPQQQDHEIEGPAKLLNYVIIALFFAIAAILMRKFSDGD